jgi:hypothetical protein
MKLLSASLIVVLLAMSVPVIAEQASIQERLAAAAPGDEVVVGAGVYFDLLSVPDGVTLIGDGADTTILDGGGQGHVVTMGKNAVLAGFTVRNGVVGVANTNECFFTVADCRVTANTQYGILVRGGSALIVSNLISGTRQLAGVACLQSNPYIMDNVFEGNPIGVVVAGKLVPTIVDNVFIGNQTAIRLNSANAITGNNTFDRNNTAIVGGNLHTTDRMATVDLAQLVAYNRKPGRYTDLIRRVFDQVTAEHPVVLYTLLPEDGQFLVATVFPWATFTVASATPDTKINGHLAFDVTTQDILASERITANQRPAVAVRSDNHPDMELNRYALDMAYEHAASYYTDGEGRRHFKRLTSFSIIRIAVPAGWKVSSLTPQGTAESSNGQEVATVRSCGRTMIDLALERVE